MNVKDVCESLDFKIVGGSEYQWYSFGENCRWLDFETEYGYTNIVYDTKTQVVYEAESTDIDGKYNYKFIKPSMLHNYLSEADSKNVNVYRAYDNVDYTMLEDENDFLDKAKQIMNGKQVDTRISVPLNLDDFELLELCLEAHKRDVTLNKMVEIILQDIVDKNKSNQG